MKILFLNHNLVWRGTFFRAYHLARQLVRLGHDVDLWTVSKTFNPLGARYVRDGVRIWETPRWGTVGKHDGGYAPVDIASRMIHAPFGDWDIVHAFDHRPNVSLPWYLRKIIKQDSLFCADWCDWWTGGGITTARRKFSWIDSVERKLEEGTKRAAHLVTAISSTLRDRALSIGVKPDRLKLLPSGADIEGIPALDAKTCREIVGLRANDPALCFVGYSLWDMELIAEMFALVLQVFPKCQLLVVGGGVESPSLDVLKKRFNVGNQVYLPGDVPYALLPKFLGAATMHLLPLADTLANRARVPNKLGDYLASGRPIVTNDVGDSGQVIRAHDIGKVAESSSKAFADAVIDLLNLPQDELDRIGENSRNLAEGDLSWQSIASELDNAYKAAFLNID